MNIVIKENYINFLTGLSNRQLKKLFLALHVYIQTKHKVVLKQSTQWIYDVLVNEIDAQERLAEQKSNAGKKGAENRWNEKKTSKNGKNMAKYGKKMAHDSKKMAENGRNMADDGRAINTKKTSITAKVDEILKNYQ